jgi:hypothetical protein
VCGWLESSSDISKRAIVALDIELVLQRHGNAMQRPDKSSSVLEELVQTLSLLQSIVKKNFCKAAELLDTLALNYAVIRIRASLSVPVSKVEIGDADGRWGCYTVVSFDGPGLYVA